MKFLGQKILPQRSEEARCFLFSISSIRKILEGNNAELASNLAALIQQALEVKDTVIREFWDFFMFLKKEVQQTDD